MVIKNSINKINTTYLLIFLNILSYFNYLIFLFFFILYSWLLINRDMKLSNTNRFLLKFIPINYYLNSFYNIFSENLNSSIFWDMQNFTHYLRCNKSEFRHLYMNNKVSEKCWETIGYGPLSELLIVPFDNIWEFTLIAATIFTVFLVIYLIKINNNLLISITVLISPGFHFMYFGLSTDIFIFLFLIYLLNKEDLNFSIMNLLFLSFFTQLKSFPIFIFLGYLIIFYLKKEFKSLTVYLVTFLVNLALLFNHYFLANYFLPEPMSYTRSFGLLHDYKLLFNHIKFDEFIWLVIAFALLLIFNYKNKWITFNIKEELSYKILFLFPTTLFINLYQNWGYKFIFNSIFIFLIFQYSNKIVKFLLIMTNLFATTYYSIGWGFEPTYFNYFLISLSKLLFYSYFFLSIFIFIKHMKMGISQRSLLNR